LTQCCETLGWG